MNHHHHQQKNHSNLESHQPQSLSVDHLINKICCSLINRLQSSLNCVSPSIKELHQLSDGIVLAELIELFEDIVIVRASNNRLYLNDKSQQRLPLQKQYYDNIDYIEQWLKIEGIHIDTKRSIRELFAEMERGQRELNGFFEYYNQFNDSKRSSIEFKLLINNQQKAIYDRSIAYIAALCYAIITIFIRYDQIFRQFITNYNFKVHDDELLHILFYTKWKLTEEELLLKDLEYMHLKDRCDLLELQLKQQQQQQSKLLILEKSKTLDEINETNKNNDNNMTMKTQLFSQQNNSNQSSTMTISSLNELDLVDSSTITTIHGHIDRPIRIEFDCYPTNHDKNLYDYQNVVKQQSEIPENLNKQKIKSDQYSIQIPSGSYWNNVEIHSDSSRNHPMKTFPLNNNHQQQQKQQNRKYKQIELSDYPEHQSSSSSACIIDRNSFDFDTSKINVDRALKYGQNKLTKKSNDNCLANKNPDNHEDLSMQIFDNNKILDKQQKSNKNVLDQNMNETDLTKYLAKIPSADPNRPSAAKTLKFDKDYDQQSFNNSNDLNIKINNQNSSFNTRFKHNNIDDGDERNRILISRLLAELSYEKQKKKMESKSLIDNDHEHLASSATFTDSPNKQFTETNVAYI
ncbi:uncharacterized protein LOC113792529 [Dermatophagoides pteronyssinus]|uniref:uncharacterized protein LOC113792529 n=1 Tax=Dermatophagoides pteronyssinus TaxID=6956 RepID=UPI003F67EF68